MKTHLFFATLILIGGLGVRHASGEDFNSGEPIEEISDGAADISYFEELCRKWAKQEEGMSPASEEMYVQRCRDRLVGTEESKGDSSATSPDDASGWNGDDGLSMDDGAYGIDMDDEATGGKENKK